LKCKEVGVDVAVAVKNKLYWLIYRAMQPS